MEPAVDVSTLPQQAQRLLDPKTPPALRTLGARGIAPGLKPGEALTVVCLLAEGEDVHIADMAKATLKSLPVPVLNGALTADLPPGVLDVVAPQFAGELAVMERILAHPNLLPSTVAKVAAACSEPVSELIATNEERLLKHPEIIEKLYMNRRTRMSTTDRLIELAVRNGLELTGIPAFMRPPPRSPTSSSPSRATSHSWETSPSGPRSRPSNLWTRTRRSTRPTTRAKRSSRRSTSIRRNASPT